MLNNAIDFGSNMDSKSNLESHLALLETVNQPRTNVHVSDSKPTEKPMHFGKRWLSFSSFLIIVNCSNLYKRESQILENNIFWKINGFNV